MTIAPLLGELRQSAQADAARRLEDARAEVERLTSASRTRLARRKDDAVRKRSAELALDRSRRMDEARNAATRETLTAAAQVVDRVLQRVLVEAPQYAGSEAAAHWLATVLPEAIAFLPDGPVTLRTDAPRAGAAARTAAPDRDVTVQPGESSLGIALSAGRVRVDASIERYLQAERARLAQEILRLAMPEPP